MKLIHKETGREAVIGETYNGHVLEGFRLPQHAASSGKCWTADGNEFFVGVLGLEWTERDDRPDWEERVGPDGERYVVYY